MDFYQKKFPHVKIEIKEEHQLWVRLDNQTQMNAITYEMIDSLTTVLNHANFDKNIRVVVLTGLGKHFCAGGDVKAMEEKSGMFSGDSNELRALYESGIQRIPECIESLSVPVIAMVNGAAIGAGCDLAMMCDLRVGSEFSKFAETFNKLGLVPGDGGTFFLQRVIGYSKAMEMFLTAKVVAGNEAYQFGLLNHYVTDAQNLEARTQEYARQIQKLAPVAVSLTKKAMKCSYLNDLRVSLDLLASYQGIAQRTEDHFEALDAMKTKREPKFTGV